MMAGILVLSVACFVFWLVFLKLKLLRMMPGWVFGFSIVVLHLMLIFVIGLRFVTPQSASAKVVQHTIQLIPRLSEPTLVTAVLVEDNTDVKKDQPLFRFERTIYEAKVAQLEAQLAAAKQNVGILEANVEAAKGASLTLGPISTTRSTRKGFLNGSCARIRRELTRSRSGRTGSTRRREPRRKLKLSSPPPNSHSNPKSTASTPASPISRRN